jgi:hypothetical protein
MLDGMPIDSSKLYRRILCFVLFFAAAAASFSGFYQKWHFAEADMQGEDRGAGIEEMLDGTANRPSVYRQLLPATANWLDRRVPQSAKAWLDKQQASNDDKLIDAISASPTANDPRYSFRYVVIYVGTFLFALLAVSAMYLVCRTLAVPWSVAMAAPILVILLMPYLMTQGGFFYDYPELAFFALAVWVSLRCNWWWLVPITVLGTWNKETFLFFLVTLYPLLRERYSRRAVMVRMAALAAISLAVLVPIHVRFAHNPGGDAGVWWRGQLGFLLSPHNLFFATEETYGVRMLSAFTVLPLALMAWTAVRGWRLLPRAMQRHASIAAAINIPLYLVFCNPGELRNLSMLYLALLVLIAVNLNRSRNDDAYLG